MNIEAFIPPEYSLNGAAAELSDWMKQEMGELARKQNGDLLDWSLAESDDEGIVQAAEALAGQLGMEGPQGEVVALRALLFSKQTLRTLSIADLDIDFAAYFRDVDEKYAGDPTEYCKQEVDEYLKARPELAALVNECSPMIDSAGGFRRHVSLLCGLSYMLLERAVAEEHVALSIETVSPEDFTDED